MSDILKVENINKEYKEFSLKNIGFTIPKGYIMGLVGENGAGKTTTLRAILNMININSGNVQVMGLNYKQDSIDIKQNIGVVFDEIFYPEDFTINNIERIMEGFYSKWNRKIFYKYIKEFNLSPRKKVKELSRGMKMKLMLSVALSHDAKLLILDEPTTGLDPVARDTLLDLLMDYMKDGERSILFSTHVTTDLEKIADYLTIINNGEIFYTGTKDDLLEKYVIIKGSKNSINSELMQSLIGYKNNSIGFSAMVNINDIEKLKEDVYIEKPQIDDILIYLSKQREVS